MKSQNSAGTELIGMAAVNPIARGPALRSIESRTPTAAADKEAWAKQVADMAVLVMSEVKDDRSAALAASSPQWCSGASLSAPGFGAS